MNNEEKIISLLEANNGLLAEVLTALQDGIKMKRDQKAKYPASTPLSDEDYDALNEEVDIEWWYETHGEEILPAKYMNRQGLPYAKQELDYLFRRLVDIAQGDALVNGGTHQFIFLGKKYCPREKNTLNVFQCVPV